MIVPVIHNELYIGDRHSFCAVDFVKNTISLIFDSSYVELTDNARAFYKRHGIVYIKSTTQDHEGYNIFDEFDKHAQLFVTAYNDGGGKGALLFVCDCAISRSVTYVLLYLLKMKQTTLKASITHIKLVVADMAPNIGFIKQLICCENQLFGTNTVTLKEYIRFYFNSQRK